MVTEDLEPTQAYVWRFHGLILGHHTRKHLSLIKLAQVLVLVRVLVLSSRSRSWYSENTDLVKSYHRKVPGRIRPGTLAIPGRDAGKSSLGKWSISWQPYQEASPAGPRLFLGKSLDRYAKFPW